jgi:hypothetical protein
MQLCRALAEYLNISMLVALWDYFNTPDVCWKTKSLKDNLYRGLNIPVAFCRAVTGVYKIP